MATFNRFNDTIGGFPDQSQWSYDPYSYTYNSGWMDQPNFNYGNPQENQPTYQNFSDYQQYNQPYSQQEQNQASDSNMSLEDVFHSFMTNSLQYSQQEQDQSSYSNMSLEDAFHSYMTNSLQYSQQEQKFQQEFRASLQSLSIQIEQLTAAVSQLEVQSVEELPSHIVADQEDDESEIVLSSGKEIETPNETTPTSPKQEEADNINAYEDCVNVDNDVLCGDDMSKVEEVVELTETKNFEDAITNCLGLMTEEIEQKQVLKGATDSLNSLPLISVKNTIFSIPLPVTHENFLLFILQDSIPNIKGFSNYIKCLFREDGGKSFHAYKGRCNLPIRDVVMDGVRKIHEIGVT